MPHQAFGEVSNIRLQGFVGVIGAEVGCHQPGVGQLIIRCIFKADGKGLDGPGRGLAHAGYDCTGVDSTAQKSPQGYIAHQA